MKDFVTFLMLLGLTGAIVITGFFIYFHAEALWWYYKERRQKKGNAR
jgi:hypothetical protein